MADIIQTLAGKAGLFRDCSRLTASGWQQEQSARQSLERWCAYCGQSSCYGFGETLTTVGVLTSAEPACVAQAEAWLAGSIAPVRKPDAAEIARRDCPAPPAKPLTPASHKAPDLFGEAA